MPSKRQAVKAKAAEQLVIKRAEDKRSRKIARRWNVVAGVFRAVAGAARGLWALRFRHRRQLAPFWVLAGLWVAGFATTGVAPGGVLILALIGAAAALFRLRGALDRRVEQVYALTGCGLAVVWLVVCAALGDTRMDWVGIVMWAGFAVPWWHHHAVRPGDAPPVVHDGTLEQWWTNTAEAFGAPWPESRMIEVAAIDNGVTCEIVLPPGKLTTADAVAKAGRIASARERSVATTLVEPTRTQIENRFRLTLLERSRVDAVHHWPGPQLDPTTGLAPVGPYADQGVGYARFWRPGSGPTHWMVCGCTDGGKSRFLDWTLLESRHSGLIASWVGDPQGGQSLPAWRTTAHRFEDTPEGISDMLRDLEAEMDARSRDLARREWTDEDGNTWMGVDHFDPTPEDPIIELVLDEAQDITVSGSPELKILEKLARKSRKTGIRLVLATQMPSIDQLGGSMTLRGQVVAGCVASLRTAENVTKNMVLPPSFPVNPYAIPRETPEGETTAGTMYLYGPRARPVPLRNWLVPKVHSAAVAAPTIPLTLRSVTPATVRPPTQPFPAEQPGDVTGQDMVGAGNIRDAILGLNWGARPEMRRGEIVDTLKAAGYDYSLSAVQKALNGDNLSRPDGELLNPSHGLYRRTATQEVVV